ncbi:hypothetical protein JQ621_02945 [Bradyrhizobium manausense]|uniref:hypothetical protein n=1 Tax=Bradyrhizobium manausense TaxID=989370 RepID=UPI001BAE016D|nr:hypothetical protein [Bradyrhizobium manausense]MBR1086427.1 hypothetical protein [Bradyrhizobium manausense]
MSTLLSTAAQVIDGIRAAIFSGHRLSHSCNAASPLTPQSKAQMHVLTRLNVIAAAVLEFRNAHMLKWSGDFDMTEDEQRKIRERDEIAARVAAFRATQEKFKREREEYFVSTLDNARKVERPSLWP